MFRNILLTPEKKETQGEEVNDFTADWNKIEDAYKKSIPNKSQEKERNGRYILETIGQELQKENVGYGFMSKPYVVESFAQALLRDIHFVREPSET